MRAGRVFQHAVADAHDGISLLQNCFRILAGKSRSEQFDANTHAFEHSARRRRQRATGVVEFPCGAGRASGPCPGERRRGDIEPSASLREPSARIVVAEAALEVAKPVDASVERGRMARRDFGTQPVGSLGERIGDALEALQGRGLAQPPRAFHRLGDAA